MTDPEWIFRKLEVWITILILSVTLIGAVIFGAIVKSHAEGRRSFGAVGDAALHVAAIPGEIHWTLRRFTWTGFESPYLAFDTEDVEGSGLEIFDEDPIGYLLLSRYEPDLDRIRVELVDLDREAILHSWETEHTAEGPLGVVSSYPWPDGSLTFLIDYRLVQMDRCGNVEWIVGDPSVHHSVETDADGFLWVPAEEGIARVSRQGEAVLIDFEEVLISNGYRALLHSLDGVPENPLHMNDIQPVLEDGPHWRRGDLFISMRTPSAVLLYRPSSDEIVWFQIGPWLHQHDVEIIGDSEISIFSNNAAFEGMIGASEVFIHDFETGKTRSPWREAMALHEVHTPTQGRSTVIGAGSVWVEETDRGRTLALDTEGAILWRYVNRGSDGEVYQLLWSRYLTQEEGERIAGAIEAGGNCK